MWYALRPEKLNISRTRPEQKDNVVEGVVEDIAYMGDQSSYRVRLKTGKIVRLTRTNRDRGEEAPITWDETVYLSWGPFSGVVLAS
jgi:putrescine transport system ATP-binding protein